MADLKRFKLPDVGEGLTEADIIKWHVQPGDAVEVNQTIVEIETAKAVVELPCPYEGVVAELMVGEGETVDVGTPIIAVDVAPGETSGPPAAAATPRSVTSAEEQDMVPAPPAEGAVEPGLEGGPAPKAGPPKEERQPVLVGYGVKMGATKRRPRKKDHEATTGQSPARPETAARPGSSPGADPALSQPAQPDDLRDGPYGDPHGESRDQRDQSTAARVEVLAKPPVRKMAKDLGVDLTTITGSGPRGSITREDVQTAAALPTLQPAPATPPARREREERVPIKGVRKHTAAAMVRSAFTAPHVTEWLQLDVTETMNAVRRLRELPDFAGVKVSPLLLVGRALLLAVRRHPLVNSAWDEQAQEIVVKHYVNLGIAAATARGLIVPNIKDAHELSLPELAKALTALAETARSGKTPPADLTGGTITITNVGVFGVDAGTPILNPGESAILAFGQIRDMPWVHEGELAIRKVTTLALSFDHRIVDGELGSAVLRDVGAMLEDPVRMLAWS